MTRRMRILAAALLLPASALAAPGFIAGSFVDGDGHTARLSVQFRCGVEYVSHEPESHGDSLRIRLESTSICNGVSPGIAQNREQYRPIGADDARLVSMEYDGDSPTGQVLRLDFSQDVRIETVRAQNANTLLIEISLDGTAPPPSRSTQGATARMVRTPPPAATRYVINLESSLRPFATADLPKLNLSGNMKVFTSDATIDGKLWHRLRVGYFDSADEAARALRQVRGAYPSAWIDRAGDSTEADIPAPLPAETEAAADTTTPVTVAADTKVEDLMADARRSMISGNLSHAVQVYTKVLQMPPNEYQQEAQEYLAVARERNGQLAHAKAEYERYLTLYPEGEGAERVQQRLAALLAAGSSTATASTATASGKSGRQRPGASPWNVRTFVSQFYRRDVNQPGDQDQIVSQSSVYSDVSVDVRRRGERFDFSARFTGGHNYDLLDQPTTTDTGNVRLSYAYVDLADAKTRLRGRLGRQTRNSGGVLGRFDGIDLSYGITEKLRLDVVAGKPVYSTAGGVDKQRSFVGLSTNFGPIGENLDLGIYVLQQTIEGLTDRQSIGGELRYFGETRSLWGMIDYDTSFSQISSMFLQGSWRLPAKLTITGVIDRRQSPYLSLGNSMIGQFVDDFSQMKILFNEDELRQLALDRSASTTTTTLGLSKALTPKLQLGLNATRSSVDATTASAGVPANPQSEYSYYSVDLVASSLFSQRDVSIVSVRYSQSGTSDIYTFNLDTRFGLGPSWRISPRLRIDYREITTDGSQQWSYTPGLRLEYRRGRALKFELQAGKQISTRQITDAPDQDLQSYYVSAGYQWFF